MDRDLHGPARRAERQRAKALDASRMLDRFTWHDTPQGHEYWSKVYKNLRDIGTPPSAAEMARPERLLQFSSPNVTTGYQTVLGYLAERQDDRLSADPQATQRDGFWLASKCAQLGYTPIQVDAPHALRAYGILRVNSYPVSLLKQRFGPTKRKRAHPGPGSGQHRFFTGCGADAGV